MTIVLPFLALLCLLSASAMCQLHSNATFPFEAAVSRHARTGRSIGDRRVPTPGEVLALRQLIFDHGLAPQIQQEVQGRQAQTQHGGELMSFRFPFIYHPPSLWTWGGRNKRRMSRKEHLRFSF